MPSGNVVGFPPVRPLSENDRRASRYWPTPRAHFSFRSLFSRYSSPVPTESGNDHPRARFREHPLEYVLGIFAEVRPGEAISTLLLTSTVFLLLTAYYMLKVAREPLILLGGGAEVKSYASAGQAVILVGFSFAYGALAKRVSRIRLVVSVSLFFVSNLAALFVLAGTSLPIGIPFYLWVGVFNMSVVAQFWGFAADVLGDARGKRLFPVLGIGSSGGAVAGAGVARWLVFVGLGPRGLMLGAGLILLLCTGLIALVHARESKAHSDSSDVHEQPLSGPNGFAMLLADRYLLMLGIVAIVLNAINTTGEYVVDRVLIETATTHADPKAFIGAFKATYFGWVNVIGVVLQMFAVSRILKYVGLARALFFMPLVSFLGYGAIAIFPVLNVVFAAKLGENGLDYSLANTCRQSLWLPTSKAAKYKAKQVVDTFLVRIGDVCSAGVVWLGGFLGLATRHFALINAVLVLCWVAALVPLVALYRKQAVASS
jgi:ATP:ADP antiporter, AAA family